MYSIVGIGGKQFHVEKGQILTVPRVNLNVGEFGESTMVFLLEDNGKIEVGRPHVEGVSVRYKVINHFKGDKVVVFKKKRRTGYHKIQGFRPQYTKILVDDIVK